MNFYDPAFALNSSIANDIAAQYKTAVERELRTARDALVREILERSLELNAKKLESVLEACFFASFEREEGKTHDFTVAIAPSERALTDSLVERLPPDVFAHTYVFENLLDIGTLAKISPALSTTRQRIGVWFDGDQAKIWGFSGMDTRMSAAVQIRP